MSAQNQPYPVTVRGELSIPPHGAWWLIKWLMAIPHWVILIILTIGAAVAWIISLFAILFTGKYPKSLFDYNVGVMRWWWRVGFYAFTVLGTDKYPPFSFDPDPSYPADLEVVYPDKLSKGLVLVKWWLLAIPHYIVVDIITGRNGWWGNGGGLALALSIFAAVVVLFKDKYPEDIFKLVVGLNRWSFRVAAYVWLMTDKYPPFRLWDD